MPNGGADGSVIIDTGMDTSGFEKGADEIESRIKKLTDDLNHNGEATRAAVESSLAALQSIAENTAKIYDTVSNSGRQAAAANDTMTESVQQEAAAAGQAITAMRQLHTGVISVDRGAAALDKSMGKLEDSLKNGLTKDSSVLRFQAQLADAQAKADALGQRLAGMAQEKVPVEGYDELTKALEKAEKKLFSLYDKRDKLESLGTKTNSKQWQSLAYDIKNAEQSVADYQRELAALNAGGGSFVQGSDTEQYKALSAYLDEVNARIEQGRALINSEALEQAQLNILAAQEAVVRAETDKERADAMERLKAAQAELSALAGKAAGAGGPSEPDNQRWLSFSEIMRGLGVVLKDTAGAAVKLPLALGKANLSALKKGFQTLTEKIKEFAKSSKQTVLTSNGLVKALNSVKNMLISRVKRMFISYLMSEIKSAVSSLVQYSSEFNAAISGMRNRTTELGGNIAVTASNIVNAFAPAITKIVGLVSQAVSYLNAFFALLGGRSTVTVAKKQTDDYAKSLSGAAKATKDLDKANKTLSIDELNVISDDTSDAGNGGGAGAGMKDLYEDVPIDQLVPEGLLDWFERIKEAFEAGDWFAVGAIIAEGLNVAMLAVDGWINNTLRPTAVLWTGRIAEILNGLVYGLDWELLGKTIADGLNTIIDVVDTFIRVFDFGELGNALGDAINGLFGNIEWARAGAGLMEGFNEAVRFFRNAIARVDWWGIGNDIATFLLSAVNNIDWPAIGELFSNAITGLGALIVGFFSEIDWTEFGYTMYSGLGSAIKAVDWLGVVASFATAAVTIAGGFVNLILGELAGVADMLADGFSAMGLDSVAGFLRGISDALVGIGAWIKSNVIDPVVGWFKDLLGIHSPSTVFSEIGDFLIQGLLQGISDAWHTITDFFSDSVENLKSSLLNGWEHIKSTASTAWNTVKSTVTSRFTEAKDNLFNTAENVKSTLFTAWDSVKTTAQTKWANVKMEVTNKFTELKNSLSTTADTIKSTISNAWDSVKTTAQTKWTDLKSTVNGLWTGLKDEMGRLDWTSIGSNLVSGIKQGISNAWNSFSSWVSDKFHSVIDAAKSAFGIASPSKVFAEIGEYLDEGLMVGMENRSRAVLSTIKNLAGSISDTAAGAHPELQLSARLAGDNLSSVADTLMGIAQSFSAIADALAAMGGLLVPSIAAGTVAPYQTRIAPDSPGANTDNLITQIAAGNTEMMALLRELLGELIEAVQESGGNLYIGDEQIVRSYDRGNAARGIRVSRGAFADAY